MRDATKRFSSRVDNYIKYRPSYPQALIDLLAAECGLSSDSTIADIGSGTGILAELLLQRGYEVIGVEPNDEMRSAGDRLLQGYPRFTSVAGTAETTTLSDGSVDLVTAGQAFHWFDHERFRAECVRILKPSGSVALIWNDRRLDSSPFLQAYERLLLTHGTDYTAVNHKQFDDESMKRFFGAGRFHKASFENLQTFDFEGVKGRLLSSSYVPEADHPSYQPMLDELQQIFGQHQTHGQVVFEYDTIVYYGQASALAELIAA
jgi:SAM-dependent methyltransferase